MIYLICFIIEGGAVEKCFKKINKDSDGVFKFTVEPNDILTNKGIKSICQSDIYMLVMSGPP